MIYWATLSVSQKCVRKMNLKKRGNTVSLRNWGDNPEFCCRKWGKWRWTLSSMIGVLACIWAGHLPDTWQDLRVLLHLLCVSMSLFSHKSQIKKNTLFWGRNRPLRMISPLLVSGYLSRYEGVSISTVIGAQLSVLHIPVHYLCAQKYKIVNMVSRWLKYLLCISSKIKLLKTRRRLLNLKTQFVPRSKHFPPRL